MTSNHKTLLAILIAPLATPLLMTAAQLLVRGKLPMLEPKLIYLAISYAFSYTLGIPIYLLARRRRWMTARAYMAAGFLMGLTATLGFFAVAMIWTGPSILPGLVVAIPIGLLTTPIGLLFWVITRPDRPTDKISAGP